MWSKYPAALPGIDLQKSELVVLDGDRHDNQPDGRTALRRLLKEQPDFNYFATPIVFTPHDGAHAYFSQNGHELTNQEGNLPAGINVRGVGGYTICPYAVLPDGQQYRGIPRTPDLVDAYRAGTVPPIPEGVVSLIQARKGSKAHIQSTQAKPGIRESAYADAALEGCTQELAACPPGSRNELLNKLAYRLGRMVARGWLYREHVEANLSARSKQRCARAWTPACKNLTRTSKTTIQPKALPKRPIRPRRNIRLAHSRKCTKSSRIGSAQASTPTPSTPR
jgi:hypothetical protein